MQEGIVPPSARRSMAWRKLMRMLSLAVRHQGTHVAIGAAVSILIAFYSSRSAARERLKKQQVDQLMEQWATLNAPSRVQSAQDLLALGETSTGASRMVRSASVPRLLPLSQPGRPSPMRKRQPSFQALATLVEEHELCDTCLSRCASHDSLRRLDEDVGCASVDGEDDETLPAAMRTPTTSAALVEATETFKTPPPQDVSATPCEGACRCEVCEHASSSWKEVVRRVLLTTAGGALSYILWLRFVASKPTARRHVFALTRFFGSAFFQFRASGAERIPRHGPAILCAYHGFIPLDLYFFHEYVARTTGRLPTTLVADFVFNIPVFSYLVRVCGGVPASRRHCLDALNAGGLVLVAPGGVREAMTTSAEDYRLRWFGKTGFAEMALATGAPVLPMFTRGIREVFLVLGGSLPIVQRLYRLTKLPFTPFVGPLPQALTSFVGEALTPRPGTEDAPELARRVMGALEGLISAHAAIAS